MNKKHTATLFAILAAALYAINIPLSKILLHQVSPTMMAAFYISVRDLGFTSTDYLHLKRKIANHLPKKTFLIPSE